MKFPGFFAETIRPPEAMAPAKHRGATAVARRFATLALLAGVGSAAAAESSIADLSIEELMNTPVTSVSKKETRLSDSAAAIAVVSAEDIRRLGITSLPEALRLVPGMEVTRIAASTWAVSARGFNGEFANKLLVLVDGRTIYSPASAGVFWNVQDVVLADVERIEVIRGPGATLWGANAVNGVINVITKNAQDTQGGLASVSLGSEDRPSATIRYGGQLAPDLYYRVYAKYFNRDGLVDAAGRNLPDDWRAWRSGFRLDWNPTPLKALMIEGEAYSEHVRSDLIQVNLAPAGVQLVNQVEVHRGGHLLGRWTQTLAAGSELTFQTYYDRVDQSDIERRDTLDVAFQHSLALGATHSLLWGTGYRFSAVDSPPNFTVVWTPRSSRLRLFDVFVQDEIALAPDRMTLTVGSKFEHNNLTGWQVQPSARLRWTPAAKHVIWTAVSRAARTPDLFERGAKLNATAFQPDPAGPPVLVSFMGNPAVEGEKMTAYEAGWRFEPTPRLAFDLSGFRHDYTGLIAYVANPVGFEASPDPPHLLASSTAQNVQTGRTHGVEISLQWQPMDHWRWMAGYSWLHTRFRPDPTEEKGNPGRQIQIRSYLDLPRHWELSVAAYHVAALEVGTSFGPVPVPAYIRLDVGATWRPVDTLEFSVWGQNLTDPRHPESTGPLRPQMDQVPRGFVAKATWRF